MSDTGMNWYWGDLHCHTNLSYGRGTMERAIAIAREHLDFCSITGHAFWPDIPTDLQHADATISMHLGGFAKCRQYWPDLLEIIGQARTEGFAAFPSFEWHSNRYGDYVLLGRDSYLALKEPVDVAGFSEYFSPDRHLLIPHHIGYTENQRGIDWEAFRQSNLVGPVEIYSNHGCAMSDDAPYDYFHTMGPRDGKHTVNAGLEQGIQFGFLGSTDSHDGFPGHYSHGRTGVLATDKTPEAIWDALQNRRTVAVTGARIESQFSLNTAGIGEAIVAPGERQLTYTVTGNQPIRQLSLVRNGRVIHQQANINPASVETPGRYRCKIEWGWGLKDEAVSWDCDLRITGGSIVGVEPAFRHTTFDTSTNDSPHAITEHTASTLRWRSETRGVPDSFVHNPETMTSGVNALIVDIEATPETELQFTSNNLDCTVMWRDFRHGSVVAQPGDHQAPAVRFRRPYTFADCTLSGTLLDEPENDTDVYYLWATQIDGESLWTSPIWASREEGPVR